MLTRRRLYFLEMYLQKVGCRNDFGHKPLAEILQLVLVNIASIRRLRREIRSLG